MASYQTIGHLINAKMWLGKVLEATGIGDIRSGSPLN
jgi:hypothetical protein